MKYHVYGIASIPTEKTNKEQSMIKCFTILFLTILCGITANGQEFWTPTGSLAGSDFVQAIECSPAGTLLAYSHNHGIYRSTDEGNSWNLAGITNQNVFAIKTSSDGNIYAVCNTTSALYIQRSTDDGMTWNIVYSSSRPNNFFYGGGIVFSGSDTILAVIAFTIGPTLGDVASEIVRSADGGTNWQLLGVAAWDASDLIKLPDGRIVVAGGLSGILYSSDNGTSWNGFPGFPAVYPTFLGTDSQGNIFAGVSTAAVQVNLLYRSTDNGVSWQGLDLYSGSSGEVQALYVDHQDRIYASANTFSPDAYNVFRSEDAGSTWDTLNSGLPSTQLVRSLCGNSNDIIFAGTGSGGVYKGADVTPVNLESFSAVYDAGTLTLHWMTATETNNKGFDIERKSGHQWQKIGYADGNGTTAQRQSYSFKDNNPLPGLNYYRLKQIDFSGQYKYSEELQIELQQPAAFYLYQNYPNPFNPSTIIRYELPQNSFVSLKVYDILGNEAASVVNETQAAGVYTVQFDASKLSSGIYFYTLKAGKFSKTVKMILMR